MRKILSYLFVVILATSSMLAFTSCKKDEDVVDNTGKDPSEWTGTLNIWTWSDDADYQKQKFNEVYPKVVVNVTKYGEGYEEKVQTTVMNGAPGPDIFGADIKNVKKWTAGEFWENLSFGIYDAEELTTNLVDYVADLGRDRNGDLRALSWQATPGGFWYDRDAAEEYLGTGDPHEISQKISTMEGLLETGAKVYAESGGTMALVPSYQDLNYIMTGMRKKAWVTNNTLVIDPIMYNPNKATTGHADFGKDDYFDIAKNVRDNNLDAKYDMWGAEWYNAVENGKALGYFLPTWGLSLLRGTSTDNSVNWGLAQAPSSFYEGGTYYGIYTKARNKQLAWEFMKFVMFDEDYIETYATERNDMPSNKTVIEKMLPTYKNSWAGDQNTMEFFYEEIEKIDASTVTRYDDSMNIMFGKVLKGYVLGTYATKEAAIAAFKLDAKTNYQDMNVG